MCLLAAAHKRLSAKFPRIVRAPSRLESVEIQGLVHTMGGARANNTGISLLRKKESKCQAGVFLETAAAPSNQFPLVKHFNVLQQFWKRGPKTRRCLLRGEPLLTQESRLTASVSALERSGNTAAGRAAVAAAVGPSGGFDELPLKTQKTAQVLQESLFWWRPHQVYHCLGGTFNCCCKSCRCCHCFCCVREIEIKINVTAGPLIENFSRKDFMVRLVGFDHTFVMPGSIL